jgi:hypothetical protein
MAELAKVHPTGTDYRYSYRTRQLDRPAKAGTAAQPQPNMPARPHGRRASVRGRPTTPRPSQGYGWLIAGSCSRPPAEAGGGRP